MSENLPHSDPQKEPPKPVPKPIYYQGEPPNKKFCALLGFILFVISGALAFVFPLLCFGGLIAAIGSLFFQGYRCIFIGYILGLGLLLLCIILYCANHPLHID